MGARTDDAEALHRALRTAFPETPPLVSQAEAASADQTPAWTFCHIPPCALPGAFVFALQYHAKRASSPTLRQGPNTIFALGGFVFCTPHAPRMRAAWETTLRGIARVESKPRVLKCGAQELEWISTEAYRRRMGQAFPEHGVSFGTIAAVKLFCADLREACRRLSAENFTCVHQTKSKALFAPDPNTGYAFELIQRMPEQFMARFITE